MISWIEDAYTRPERYHLLKNFNWFRSYEHFRAMIPSAKLDHDKKYVFFNNFIIYLNISTSNTYLESGN